jgi:P-loop Domain of unknown function (DUF2791)
MIPIKRRERDAVLQALQAGLVPKQGLHLIQVGRKAEVSSILQDLDRIVDEGSSFRVVVGRFGSGKSFFLTLIRTLALQKKLVVAQADFSMERRLWASNGDARALYTELMRNITTKAQPDGGALSGILSGWVSNVQHEILSNGGLQADVETRIGTDLRDLENFVGGFEFAEVVRAWYRGHVEKNDALQASALRWLRAEYTTKTEARQELGVRRIIDDDSIYDTLKLMAAFVRKAGYGGLLVGLDEMVVLSHRLPNSRARQANYEALLTILNDCVQGAAKGLGFLFAGTDECLEDKRRGLFSYEALRSRLAENALAKQKDLVDLSGPVIRLQPLTPEDLFVLLKNIALVHAGGDPSKVMTGDDAVAAMLHRANETLGAEFFRTPRDVIRAFVGLLNLLDQNPSKTWQDLLGAGILQKATAPMSEEEALATGVHAAAEEDDDDLATIKL